MRQFNGWVAGLLLLSGSAASAEIYRCEVDEVTVFSDRPCQAEATPYQPGSSLSVVTVAEDMGQTIERNQAWLDAEAARQQARREAVRERRAVEQAGAEQATQPRPATGLGGPFVVLPQSGPPPHAIDRRLQRGQQPPRGPNQRPDQRSDQQREDEDERFSALRGRQPGSRRDP
jgi:hypothetical protein